MGSGFTSIVCFFMSLKIKVFKEKEIINSMKRIIITFSCF